MSDTHNFHHHIPEIPKGDILIHCGDFTLNGGISEVQDFAQWVSELDFTDKIVIAGNHERSLSDNRSLGSKLFDGKATYLQDSGIKIGGLKIYGTPWTPSFPRMREGLGFYKHRMIGVYDRIPDDTDILITHGPPMGILDRNNENQNVGDKELFKSILRIKPEIHTFGHIHESHGIHNGNNTKYINCSLIDQNYNLVHKPIVVDI